MKFTYLPVAVVVFTLVNSIISHVEGAPNKSPIEHTVNVKQGIVEGNLSITSKITGVTYPYHIYLPKTYDASSDKRYPVIYASDAQWVFDSFVNNIKNKGLNIILVGIEEGPTKSNRRRMDYKLPGVGQYFQFFTSEFMPLIEQTYKVDTSNRTIQGTSFGGLMSLAFMLADNANKPLFKNILTYDASVSYQEKGMLNIAKQRYKLSNSMPVNLIITGARSANAKANKKFIKKLKRIGFTDLTVHWKNYNVSHYAISNVSFPESLDILFN